MGLDQAPCGNCPRSVAVEHRSDTLTNWRQRAVPSDLAPIRTKVAWFFHECERGVGHPLQLQDRACTLHRPPPVILKPKHPRPPENPSRLFRRLSAPWFHGALGDFPWFRLSTTLGFLGSVGSLGGLQGVSEAQRCPRGSISRFFLFVLKQPIFL